MLYISLLKMTTDISVKDYIEIYSAISVKFQCYFSEMSLNISEILLHFSAISLKFQCYFTARSKLLIMRMLGAMNSYK